MSDKIFKGLSRIRFAKAECNFFYLYVTQTDGCMHFKTKLKTKIVVIDTSKHITNRLLIGIWFPSRQNFVYQAPILPRPFPSPTGEYKLEHAGDTYTLTLI